MNEFAGSEYWRKIGVNDEGWTIFAKGFGDKGTLFLHYHPPVKYSARIPIQPA